MMIFAKSLYAIAFVLMAIGFMLGSPFIAGARVLERWALAKHGEPLTFRKGSDRATTAVAALLLVALAMGGLAAIRL